MLKILTTFILIAASSYLCIGQTNSGTQHTEKDTLVLVPIQSIKACNGVKAMNDRLKDLHAEKDTLIHELKSQNKTFILQVKTLKASTEYWKQKTTEKEQENLGLKKELKKGKSLIKGLIYVAAIETAILVTILIWR